MYEWVNHHGALVLVLYYLFSTAVGRMPSPQPGGSAGYQFLYGWLHDIMQIAGANAFRIQSVRNLLGGEQPTPAPPKE
jgi:uncharacterized membrane protein YbhN (UPF0104 family)